MGAIAQKDVIRFDHGGPTFAVYRSPEDESFATEGLCKHEKVHLADSLVMDDSIERPKVSLRPRPPCEVRLPAKTL